MPCYHVQLETESDTYGFEVWTDDFNYVDLARQGLAKIIGPEQAQRAHVGGCSNIGFDPDMGRPKIKRIL